MTTKLALLDSLIDAMLSRESVSMAEVEPKIVEFMDLISQIPNGRPEMNAEWTDRAARLMAKYSAAASVPLADNAADDVSTGGGDSKAVANTTTS